MDYEADSALIYELLDLAREPVSDQWREDISDIIAEADAGGLIHSAVFARIVQTKDLSMLNDIERVVGTLAEAQQIWTAHADTMQPQLVPFILLQMGLTIMILGEQLTIPIDRQQTLRASYEQLCRQHGHPLRVPYRLGMTLAARAGDLAQADELFTRTQAEPLDPLFPEIDGEDIEFLARRGDDTGAVRRYRAIDLENARSTVTLAHAAALLPLLRLGLLDDAERAYRASCGEDDDPHPQVLSYLALRGRYDEGLRRLEQLLQEDPEQPETPRGAAVTAAHAAVLFAHLQRAGHGGDQVAGRGGSVDELLIRFRDHAEAAAARLDRVNRRPVAVAELRRFWACCLGSRTAGEPPTR